jgi:hypothetical protein
MSIQTYDFTITLGQFVEDLDAIDAVYGRLDDVSTFNSDAAARITFHREAATLDAILSVISEVQSFGYKVKQIEVEPECVGAVAVV